MTRFSFSFCKRKKRLNHGRQQLPSELRLLPPVAPPTARPGNRAAGLLRWALTAFPVPLSGVVGVQGLGEPGRGGRGGVGALRPAGERHGVRCSADRRRSDHVGPVWERQPTFDLQRFPAWALLRCGTTGQGGTQLVQSREDRRRADK